MHKFIERFFNYKKHNKIFSISFYQRRPFFYKILAIFVVLLLVTVTIFGVFVNQLVVKQQKNNIRELKLNQLQRISSEVETIFSLLYSNMTLYLWSDQFISVMLAPHQYDYDTICHVADTLNVCVTENDLVQSAYFYVPFAHDVYTNLGTCVKLEDFENKDFIKVYLLEQSKNRDPEKECEWRVISYEHRVFLITDFCLPNFIGALIYEIDQETLYDFIQTKNSGLDAEIYVYDKNGQILLFQDQLLKPSDFNNPELFTTLESGEELKSYYKYDSDILGWYFLTKVETGKENTLLQTLCGVFLPVLILYLILGFLASLFITKFIYRPIKQLLQITVESKNGNDRDTLIDSRNEVDYLELEYLESLKLNKKYKNLMKRISKDVMEQILRNILLGKNVDNDYIKTSLEGIGQHEFLSGSYVVIAIRLIYPKSDEVGVALFQRSFLSILQKIEPNNFDICPLFFEPDLSILVIHFKTVQTALQIKRNLFVLMDEIRDHVDKLPYNVIIGIGRAYNELFSLQFSYNEANDHVRFLEYCKENPQESLVVPEEKNYILRHYINKTNYIIEMAEEGKTEEAVNMADQMITEILANGIDLRLLFERLIDSVMEKLILCHISREQIKEAGISNILEEIVDINKQDELRERIKSFYQNAINLIADNIQKGHGRYVREVKNIIAKHYGNGKLSLNEISEMLGISPSYLSAIFAENTGEGLITYLNNYRVKQAKRFLLETKLNITETGYKCGFNSVQTFSRVFKKTTGITPVQYRKNNGS